jgi:hypothetical protein
MTTPAVILSFPTIPPEVQTFAAAKGVGGYLPAVLDLAGRAFPSTALQVSLGQDAEDETHQYIAIDVAASGKTAEELLAGQRTWSSGLSHVCPSHHSIYFVLGWR